MRVLRVVLPALVPFALACGQSPTNDQPEFGPRVSVYRTDSVSTLMQGFVRGYREQARLVITDAAAWSQAWSLAHAQMTPVDPAPAVDFTSSAVVLAAAGTRNSGGYSITVVRVVTFESGQLVYVTSTSPGVTCINTAMVTFPIHMVRVPKPADHVTFVEQTKSVAC